jgi:hypothetical protein
MCSGEEQISFGKIVAVFSIVGPPIFTPIFYFASDVADLHAETLLTTLHEALLLVFTIYGLLVSYTVGFLPSLFVGFTYLFTCSTSRRNKKNRLLGAALSGVVVFFLACALALLSFNASRADGGWLLTAYAAGAGAVSAFLCALIVEI